MKGRLFRGTAASVLLATAVSSSGCGYILYPERRGNAGGTIDAATLVMDLLWLLPGIIPGVVALVVDFSSGAIYTGGGRRVAVQISPEGRVAVRLPAASRPTQLEVRLVTAGGRVLTQKTVTVGPGRQDPSVELRIGDPALVQPGEEIYLEVATATGAARFPAAIEVARAR